MPDETSFVFLHALSGDVFHVNDPVVWCLEKAHSTLLGAARERLLRCVGRTDGQRILAAVLRRCGLNLIEIRPDRVTVSYWTKLADLHSLLKSRGLLHAGVEVALVRRKTGQITLTTGDQFLRGEPIAAAFPWCQYRERWERRNERQSDDGDASPWCRSSYSWEGVAEGGIPWAALKSTWRREPPAPCPNCDKAAGFSFWLKGDGTDGFAGLRFIHDDDYAVRYDLCVPVKGKKWRKVTVA